MLTTSAGSRASIHSSKSAVSIRVLPSLRRVSRRAPNGIFSVDSTSSSELSSLYSSSSDISTTSEEDEWSDDDFEDPLWVKDDNLRRSRRRQHQPTPHQLQAASTSSLASASSALVDQPRTVSDDNMVLEEEDYVVAVEPEPLLATKEKVAVVEEAVLTPRKRARGRTPGKTEEKEEENRAKTKKVNKVKKRREQQTAAYREFAMQLDTSALDDLTATTTTSTRLAQRRGKAFSVNLTPRGGLFSSSSPPSSTPPAKISPQQRERERRKMEREVMTQRHQLLAQPQPHLQHQHLVVPPLSIPPATTNATKKMEGNFWRKKMRGVKAYFSSSSSSSSSSSPSSPPLSPGAPRSTSYSPPPTPTFTSLSCLSAHSGS
jgi:hypothetical protein